MSPASSGALEVERYIGACLISSQGSRPKKNYLQPGPAKGIPHLQRCTSDPHWGSSPIVFNLPFSAGDHRKNLTRLAVQTQGIPLILSSSNKYHGRRQRQRPQHFNNAGKDKQDKNAVQQESMSQCNNDAISIASDESCASNTSDTCLPRIIKPRKRRKKDRKSQLSKSPHGGGIDSAYSSSQDAYSSATSSPDIDFATTTNMNPFHLPQHHLHSFLYNLPMMGHAANIGPSVSDAPEERKEPPKLATLFGNVLEDLSSKDVNGNERSCQCRYCDPNGQIWDVDGSYSPFKTISSTSSPGQFQLPAAPPPSLASMVPASIEEERHVVDRLAELSLGSGRAHGDLQVSTEIVTSHNGHRDLEIKFFSIFNKGQPDKHVAHEKDTDTTPEPTVTTPAPPQRPWIPVSRPMRNRPTCIFTVMCYNVLCDKYATRQMYSYCPSWALNWDYRKKGIMDEIRHYGADIINLQEVEMEQFYNYFLPELKKDGYAGIYSPKSRAKTMAENERKYVDGCAIFYRTSKFTLIKEHLVEFNQLAMANADGLDHMLNRVMPKDNIGLAALLQTTSIAWEHAPEGSPITQQPLLVCTAHIHWDPEYCDVKLIQTMMLSNELRAILEESANTLRANDNMNIDANSIQLVLCGDFNSLPESGVIEFLSSGRVSQDHKDFKDFSYKSCLEKISSCDKPAGEFTHSFKLASAYSEDIMPLTNYTFEFKGIIDYIFYSKQSMTPLGLLGPHSADWLKENKIVGCPHPHIFSDHFPLLVELEMVSTISQQTLNGIISHR